MRATESVLAKVYNHANKAKGGMIDIMSQKNTKDRNSWEKVKDSVFVSVVNQEKQQTFWRREGFPATIGKV